MKAQRITVAILFDPRLVQGKPDAEAAVERLLGDDYLVLDWAYIDGDENVVEVELGDPEQYQKGRSV
jgi:hypothetical protein